MKDYQKVIEAMKISAVIPLYNAEKYIIETLDSLLRQSYQLDEILVVDDCGTDQSAAIVEKYSTVHPSVRLIRQSHNQGGSAARNRGLAEARNEWVLMMDADDTIHPDLLKLQAEQLQRYVEIEPRPVCVHPAYVQTDANGSVLENSEYRGQQLSYEETFGSLLVRNYIITPTGLLLNRNTALKIGGYKTNFFVSEDAEFILRLSREGTFVYVDEPYVYFRRHEMSITSDLKKASQAGKAILDIYSIEEVKEAVFRRNFTKERNTIDFVTLLYQFNCYDEGFGYLKSINDGEFELSKYFLSGIYYIEKNEKNLAQQMFEKLLSIQPTHGAALNNLGVLLALHEEKRRAEVMFQEAIAQHPGYMDAAYNLVELKSDLPSFRFTMRELRENLLRYK
jgi:glycosyltransferase involved in cell wall biosynthesis